MKLKPCKFQGQYNQWGDTWGCGGGGNPCGSIVSPHRGPCTHRGHFGLTFQIGKPRALGSGVKPGLLVFMLQVKKHSWTLKSVALTGVRVHMSFSSFLTFAFSLPISFLPPPLPPPPPPFFPADPAIAAAAVRPALPQSRRMLLWRAQPSLLPPAPLRRESSFQVALQLGPPCAEGPQGQLCGPLPPLPRSLGPPPHLAPRKRHQP